MRYELRYMPVALQQLHSLSAREQRIVVDTVEEQLRHAAEQETRHRKRMRPNNLATWELRIGNLRVFYEIESAPSGGGSSSPLTVAILAVGVKKGNRLWIGNEEVQL